MQTTVITSGIQDVLPAIRARREEIERARRMPRDLVDELRRTGFFSLAVPRAYGGLEVPPATMMQSIEAIASADGSAGWCAMVGATSSQIAGYMSEAGAREIFADPTIPCAGIAAPAGTAVRTDGGLRVSGRWSYASGITHCDWVWAGCIVTENGQPRMTETGPEIVHVFLPVSEVTIHDTWHVSGLCGTGSNDFSASDVFVPDRYVFNLLDARYHRPEPLYQMPALGLFVYHLASVSLGIARGALDELMEIAQTKTPTLYQDAVADRPVAQVEIARAEAALGGARAFLYETLSDMWETVCAGKQPSNRQIALGRAAATHAVETAAAVTRTAGTLAGGSALFASSSMQRHMRDADAITHHFTVAPHTWHEAGRVLLGREPTVPAF